MLVVKADLKNENILPLGWLEECKQGWPWPLHTSCQWSVQFWQSLRVAICAQQVRVNWLCRGPEQLALVHKACQSLVL